LAFVNARGASIFFSSLHLSAEAGLLAICTDRGIPPRSRLQEAMETSIAQIEKGAESSPLAHRGIKHLRSLLRTYRPGFDDHLEGVFTTVNLSDPVKKTCFFRALTIVRNKSAHSNPGSQKTNAFDCVRDGLQF
jgi:hypothetical protein